MNITSFGKALQIKGSTIYRWYRDCLSDYAKDNSIVHRHDIKAPPGNIEVPILKIENFGERMAIDEKHLGSNICTVVSNRETGKIAMLYKGIKFLDIKRILQQYPSQMENIKSITRDFSKLFEKVCNELMPQAVQVGDKFHVIKNLLDAHQSVRIRYRQAELQKRRKAFQEFKTDEAKRALECEKMGERFKPAKFRYIEQTMRNGETPLELLARSRYLLFQYSDKWNEKQRKRAATLFEAFPEIEKTYHLCLKFRDFMSIKNIGKHYLFIDKKLHQWYEDVEDADVDELLNFKSMVESNEDIIRNYFTAGETNAMAEAINSQIQRFVTSNSGNRDEDFFYFRVGLYFA